MNQLIEKAACFAAVKHDGQYRKGTHIPYITHPYGVAMILMEEKQPEETIAAGLLHDTLEDTETTEEELFKNFGEEVLMLVKAASEKDKSQSWEMRKQHTIANLPNHSTSELYLILADKLHNLRSIHVDARKFGDSIWSRFNRGKREQCWYYMSISRAVSEKKREVPLIRKLEEETNELFIGKKRLTHHDIRLLFDSIHSDSSFAEEDLRESHLLDFSAEMQQAAGDQLDKEAPDSILNLLKEAGMEMAPHVEDDLFIYSYYHEMKFRLGWDDETFLEYFKLYYKRK
ncbi:HD domain-containing protein [Planococcus halotolerans]|uniref:HD domain-containing protein n=1 Tax=Planococcus halotolerans TaxID=2233542 RepID=UPI001091F30B|nr:HD domain-containing protein [Planococcus halotolerans]QHJ71263.1 HD domain-containing protein [Planococcus halotolerans]